jgi:uncharacterized protein (PEP-CTERM system associated)
VLASYGNTWYDYDQAGGNESFPYNSPSRSGLLDRLEHLGTLNLRWQALPQTVGILGYQYGQVDYTSDEYVALLDPGPVKSEARNNRSHYGYVGVEHNFSPDFTGSVRAGVQYVDYYNSLNSDTSIAPYVEASLRYLYAEGSYVEAGFRHAYNQTDIITPDASNTSLTTDAESSVVYASLNHKITPQLTGSLLAQYQHSTFNNGFYDSKSDDFYLAGVNLAYRINTHLSAEAGYNFDKLDSEVPGRDFTRNRVYLGVTASY